MHHTKSAGNLILTIKNSRETGAVYLEAKRYQHIANGRVPHVWSPDTRAESMKIRPTHSAALPLTERDGDRPAENVIWAHIAYEPYSLNCTGSRAFFVIRIIAREDHPNVRNKTSRNIAILDSCSKSLMSLLPDSFETNPWFSGHIVAWLALLT